MTVKCHMCGKTFDSFRGLNGHMNAHIPRHRAESLLKTSCCCGATESNPCRCMKKGPMNCSAVEPKCPCYQDLEKRADMESPDNEDRFILDITCDWCGEPYDGTEVLDNWEGRIIHRRCAASDAYEAESVSTPPCVICGDQVVMITEDMGECISCNTFWNVVELSDLWEQDVPDVLVLDAEYEQYLMCDGCGWTTPSFRVGDAYCHDCDMEVPDDDDRIDHIDCDLDVMDEEDVQEQLEFWLYEHHPDFCPAGGRVYDADWQGISLAGGIDEIEEMLKRRKL